jgi:hypothetical protein
MKPEPYDILRDDRAAAEEQIQQVRSEFTDEGRLERLGRLGYSKPQWPDDTASALLTLCDAGLYVLRSDWDERTVKGANEILQRTHDSIQARQLLEAAESVLSAGIVLDGPRQRLAGEIRQFLGQDNEESNLPGPGEPACRECGNLAEYPVEFAQYCSMCWNGQQRRRFARRHALST